MLSPGLIVARKFRLDRLIARGGMGSVWAAFNTQLEAPVALKFMSPSAVAAPDLVARFQREAKAAAQIRSPHVVQIFEHGMHEDLPYIVMELLEGEDLGSRIRRKDRLSLQETAKIVVQVCKALRRAHEVGIVHRDLKPANIFLARHDEDEEMVKVLDFGIAKSLASPGNGDDATQTGTLIGTPHYMSPEQAQRSKHIDARSDLWSVGVIAFRAITGRVPFTGDDMINVLVKVCTEPPPLPSTVAPGLGPEVDALFARALCRDIDRRFQSAREMSDAFSAFLERRALASEISFGSGATPPSSSGSPPGAPLSRPGGTAVLPPQPELPAPTPPAGLPAPRLPPVPAHVWSSTTMPETPSSLARGGAPVAVPHASLSATGPLPAKPIDPAATPDDGADDGDATGPTALDAVLSSRPGPLQEPSSSVRAFGATPATAQANGAQVVVPAFRSSSRARAAVVIGAAVVLLGLGVAFLSRSGGGASPEESGSPFTGPRAPAAIDVPAVPDPSVAPPVSTPPPSASAESPPVSASTPTASASATSVAIAPSPSGSVRPAPARGPRSIGTTRPKGAIGGAPKF